MPDLSVWDRVVNLDDFVCDHLIVQVNSQRILFNRETAWMNCYCVLSSKSHFIIYVKQSKLTGYVLKVSRAIKIKVSTFKLEYPKRKNNDKDPLLDKKVYNFFLKTN